MPRKKAPTTKPPKKEVERKVEAIPQVLQQVTIQEAFDVRIRASSNPRELRRIRAIRFFLQYPTTNAEPTFEPIGTIDFIIRNELQFAIALEGLYIMNILPEFPIWKEPYKSPTTN